MQGIFDTNEGAFAPIKDFACVSLGHADPPQPLHPVKLVENPYPVALKERHDVVVGSIGRLQNLDTIGSHPNAQLMCRSRYNEPIIDPAPAKFDLILSDRPH
jgi:hypothetical protein